MCHGMPNADQRDIHLTMKSVYIKLTEWVNCMHEQSDMGGVGANACVIERPLLRPDDRQDARGTMISHLPELANLDANKESPVEDGRPGARFKEAIQYFAGENNFVTPAVLGFLVSTSVYAGVFDSVKESLLRVVGQSKEKVLKKTDTMSWWLRYIAKEVQIAKAEQKSVDLTLAGAAGTWFNETSVENLNDGELMSRDNVAEFVTHSIAGLAETSRRQNENVGTLWMRLKNDIAALNKDGTPLYPELQKYKAVSEDYAARFSFGKRLWQEAVRTYGYFSMKREKSGAGSGKSEKEQWHEHVIDLQAVLDPSTGLETSRTEKELITVRFILQYRPKNENGELGAMRSAYVDIEMQDKFILPDETKLLEIKQKIINVLDNPSQWPTLPETTSKPVFEVVLSINNKSEPIAESQQLDLSGTAKRQPNTRLVIDYQEHGNESRSGVVSNGKISRLITAYPHYQDNEDTGRHVLRRLLKRLSLSYPEAKYVLPEDHDRTKIIRRVEGQADESLEVLEVTSEVAFTQLELGMMELARAADADQLKKRSKPRSKIGLAQLVLLAFCTKTTQPGYMCVATPGDLSIAFAPYAKGMELSRLLDGQLDLLMRNLSNKPEQVAEQLRDLIVYIKQTVDSSQTQSQLRQQLDAHLDFTSGQIADCRNGMGLLQVLDTYVPEFFKNLFKKTFSQYSDFVERASVQVSSVQHDASSMGGEIKFTTAGSLYAKLAVALRSVQQQDGSRKTYINLRHRYEAEDIYPALGSTADGVQLPRGEVENKALNYTDRLLKVESRLRMLLISLIITVLYGEEEKSDIDKLVPIVQHTIDQIMQTPEKY